MDSPSRSSSPDEYDLSSPNGATKNTGASIGASVVNLVNNVLGAGLLTLPWAFKEASLIPAICVMIMVCVLSLNSLLMISRLCSVHHQHTYKDLGSTCFGPRVGNFVQGLVAIYNSLALVSFIVLIGDFIPLVMDQFGAGHPLTDRVFINPMVAVLIILPLSLLRDLKSLRFTSLLAVFFFIYCVGLVCKKLHSYGHVNKSYHPFHLDSNVFIAMPLLNVAFTAHYNAPKFYHELKNRSLGRFKKVAMFSSAICCSLYLLMATLGYLRFGEDTEGDILNNFGEDDVAVLWVRLGTAIAIILTFPLVLNSFRLSIETLFFADEHGVVEFNMMRHAVITVAAVAVTTFAGTVYPHVEIVIAYNGALVGNIVVFVFPALMYNKTVLMLMKGSKYARVRPPDAMALDASDLDSFAEVATVPLLEDVSHAADTVTLPATTNQGETWTPNFDRVVTIRGHDVHLPSLCVGLFGCCAGIMGVVAINISNDT